MSTIRRISIILFLILITACAPDEPEATQVPIARVTDTAVFPTTNQIIPNQSPTTNKTNTPPPGSPNPTLFPNQ